MGSGPGITVDVRTTKTGAYTLQVYVPSRRAKLALNQSHYLLADERRTLALEVNGKKRDLVVILKAWVPVPRSERMDEPARAALRRREIYSPMIS